MPEYIDREKIRLEVCSDCTRQIDFECQYEKPCSKLIAAFLNEDPADVAPVVHGRWICGDYVFGETEWKCSNCGETEWRTSCSRMKYCMFCGAKMDGGEKANE